MATKEEIFYSDIIFNMEKHPLTSDLGIVTNIHSIKESIINLLLTNYGERLYHPEIGCNISALLFTNANYITAKVLKGHIITTINNYEPRVLLKIVDVKASPDTSEFVVSITFTVISVNIDNQQISFKLKTK